MSAAFTSLEQVDWDFVEESTNTTTNAIHPYPAKFIPQIPKQFIAELSVPGATAVEANVLGRNAIGNDVNELAVLIAKVKTTALSPDVLKQLDKLTISVHERISKHYSKEMNAIIRPDIINLSSWFQEHVINELVIIKEEIEKLPSKDLQDFGLVALSGIIINVSNQDSDTRYVRVPKTINFSDTYNRFIRQLNKMKRAMLASYKELAQGISTFKVADTRTPGLFPENSAHLAVTSPPYPNAYDYHLYHKYRLFWLGMNPHNLRKREIGAHADYSKKNGPDEFDFMKDMEKCMINTSAILIPGAHFVLVIGDSILKGRHIQNNEILKEATKDTPFKFITEYTRSLNLRRKSFNPKIGNIKTEKILVFQNIK